MDMAAARDSDLNRLGALIELCEAQQMTIQSLRAAIEQRERDDRAREQLKVTLAHELRTPLTAVIGTLYTLAIPGLEAKQAADLVQRALRQAQQLHELTEDLLKTRDSHYEPVSRAQQEILDVAELLDDVCVSVSARLAVQRLRVEVPTGLTVRTHPGRLRQILVNLLVNAAKYTPETSPVTIEVTAAAGGVSFNVIDRGPGIPAETVDEMFEPFRQGPNGVAAGGLGIGLYLVRGLAQSLGGTVELLPNPAGGTVARVTLPQKRQEDRRSARRRVDETIAAPA
jgi:two-component system sensor histidine kinase KdpD